MPPITKNKKSETDPTRKSFYLQVKQINQEDNTIEAIASTDDLDRDNEIIKPSAFKNLKQYLRDNPAVLASHLHRLWDGSSPLIANVVEAKLTDEGLWVKIQFHLLTRLSQEYWELYVNKKQRALSVGFIPVEGDFEIVNDRRVYVYTEVELLEISCVPIGSNRAALARVAGFFEDENAKQEIIEAVKVLQDEQFGKILKAVTDHLDEKFEEIKSIIISDSDGFAEELLLGSSTDPSADAENQKNGHILEQMNQRLINLENKSC